MDIEAISQAIRVFRETELPEIREELSLLQQNNAFPNHILKGRTEDAKRAFIEKTGVILPRLNRCSTFDQIMDVCREAFLPIRGIGEETIRKYAYHYAYINDIDTESDCFCCLLTTTAKEALRDTGLVEDNHLALGPMRPLFCGFSNSEIIAFINTHYSLFALIGKDN